MVTTMLSKGVGEELLDGFKRGVDIPAKSQSHVTPLLLAYPIPASVRTLHTSEARCPCKDRKSGSTLHTREDTGSTGD